MALHEAVCQGSAAFGLGPGTLSRPGNQFKGEAQRRCPCIDAGPIGQGARWKDGASASSSDASYGPSTSGRMQSTDFAQGTDIQLCVSSLGALQHVERRPSATNAAGLRLRKRDNLRETQSLRKRTIVSPQTVTIVNAGGISWPVVDLGAQSEESIGAEKVSEPLSCLFIGPVDEAEKVHLEALYQQARDSYYSGSPLVLDEMFDKVETRLRNLRSKLVLKYPRCSLKKYGAYSDAEEDTSQMSMLLGVWGTLGVAGTFAAVVPPLCAATSACNRLVNEALEPLNHAHDSPLTSFLLALGLLGGVPLANAAVRQVKSLMSGEVVALKGCCPNCGEEVYAFLDAKAQKPRHKSECHVCEHPLVFHATVEPAKKDGKQWAYGRVYLVARSRDLEPKKSDLPVR